MGASSNIRSEMLGAKRILSVTSSSISTSSEKSMDRSGSKATASTALTAPQAARSVFTISASSVSSTGNMPESLKQKGAAKGKGACTPPLDPISVEGWTCFAVGPAVEFDIRIPFIIEDDVDVE